MILSVHQPQYIPWIGFFDKIVRSDCFVILDRVQYKEREYVNRNRIRTNDGWKWLTVPVISRGLRRQKIGDTRIDNSNGWRKKHCNSLKSWYSRAPFFDTYFSFFENVYLQQWDKLQDLNIYIIRYMLQELQIETPVYFESDLGVSTTKTDRIIDICRKLKADIYLSGAGGKDYLEEEKFPEATISLEYQKFTHPEYQQQHMKKGSDFLPYMSSLDLLFNEGGKSKKILKG